MRFVRLTLPPLRMSMPCAGKARAGPARQQGRLRAGGRGQRTRRDKQPRARQVSRARAAAALDEAHEPPCDTRSQSLGETRQPPPRLAPLTRNTATLRARCRHPPCCNARNCVLRMAHRIRSAALRQPSWRPGAATRATCLAHRHLRQARPRVPAAPKRRAAHCERALEKQVSTGICTRGGARA